MRVKNFCVILLGLFIIGLGVVQVEAIFTRPGIAGKVWASKYLEDAEMMRQWSEKQQIPGGQQVQGDLAMEYNRATMYAQLGEQAEGEQQIQAWENAVQSYIQLLNQEELEYARYNLEILEELLQQAQQEQENTQHPQDQNDQSEHSGDQQEQQEQSGSQQAGGNQNQENDASGQDQGAEQSQSQQSPLTESQRQQLQQYQQQLQQQQFQNQQFYGKQQPPNQPQSIFDQFFGRPQFDSGQNGTQKDW